MHITDALDIVVQEISLHADILACGTDTEQDAAVWLRLFVVAAYTGHLHELVPIADSLEGAWLEASSLRALGTDGADASDMSGADV